MEAVFKVLKSYSPYLSVMQREGLVDMICSRWADCSWPNIGFFVHGQAKIDIHALLNEIDILRAEISHMNAHLVAQEH